MSNKNWTHEAFKGMKELNGIQSKVCDVVLRTSENVLLRAPTGAGKTNVALLTLLNVLGRHRRARPSSRDDGDAPVENADVYDLKSYEIVYVSLMKAVVQEVVKNFSHRLAPYGVRSIYRCRRISGG